MTLDRDTLEAAAKVCEESRGDSLWNHAASVLAMRIRSLVAQQDTAGRDAKAPVDASQEELRPSPAVFCPSDGDPCRRGCIHICKFTGNRVGLIHKQSAVPKAKLCYNRATRKIEKLIAGICVESFDPPENSDEF